MANVLYIMQRITKNKDLGIPGSFEEILRKTIHGKFTIKSELLKGCIGHVTSLPLSGTDDELLLYGFQCDKKSSFSGNRGYLGYVFLCLFVRLQLKIQRTPRYQDRHLANLANNSIYRHGFSVFCDYFGEQKIQEASVELEELYQHTQQQLRDLMPQQKTVKLCRGVSGKYAEKILRCYFACQLLDIPSFSIETDILNSYSDDGAYNDRNLLVLTQNIPVEQILYCHELIAKHDATVTEPGEWVVLNPAANGLVPIHLNNISIKKSDQEAFSKKYKFKYKWFAKLFMKYYCPITRTKL